jgi:16S rRNA (guanine527-N7)-methyltransferase
VSAREAGDHDCPPSDRQETDPRTRGQGLGDSHPGHGQPLGRDPRDERLDDIDPDDIDPDDIDPDDIDPGDSELGDSEPDNRPLDEQEARERKFEDMGLGSVVPSTPSSARAVFRGQLGVAEHFAALLCTTGVSHGLIGPREGPRIWERHLLNCAVVEELVPTGAEPTRLIDIGSGAGLPGVAIAIARPDLEVHLVEPLARRTAWLEEAVRELGLPNVTVHTARAESLWGSLRAPWVTARAVTKLLQLAQWTLPLLEGPGSLLALKGSTAAAELAKAEPALRRLGAVSASLVTAGEGRLEEPTTVVQVEVTEPVDLERFRGAGASSAGSARRRGDRPRSPGPRRRSTNRSSGPSPKSGKG